ncbi:MAG: spore coat protein U domain-containing protein [Deltaproteobacteria bacterium]|nr:spore coat protein U domain-containing protein [Deltaproteobacteria bacterium]
MTATPINFPLYDSSVAVTATGTVTVSCSSGNPAYTVSLGPSSGSNSVNPRALKHQTVPDTLTYTIRTPATTQGTPAGALWGDGTLGTIVVTERFRLSAVLTMTGDIPAGQDMTYGLYADSITATVTP